jgi:YVTN family beta-propeller protein
VIAAATDTLVSTIQVGAGPIGVAVTPDGSKVYVANDGVNTVSAIATATNTVVSTIPVGFNPEGVAVTPDGSKVYVADAGSNTVSVIATATDTVVGTISVGLFPIAFGIFIQPPSPNLGKNACKDGDGKNSPRRPVLCERRTMRELFCKTALTWAATLTVNDHENAFLPGVKFVQAGKTSRAADVISDTRPALRISRSVARSAAAGGLEWCSIGL